MDSTTVIASWGALTGTASLGFQGATHFRDRVKLNVNVRLTQTETRHVMLIEVSNRGRQPTTITEAGFLIKNQITFEIKNRGIVATAPLTIRWADQDPVLLRPGEVHQFSRELTRWPDDYLHADSPLRAFAVDSHGHRSWGEPGPFLRMLMEGGWQPRGVVDSRLVEPIEAGVSAEPVTPRWKLWKPKHERQSWSREADLGEISTRLNLTPRD